MFIKARDEMWMWHDNPSDVFCPSCGKPSSVEGYVERRIGSCNRCGTENFEREWAVYCQSCGVKYSISYVMGRPI